MRTRIRKVRGVSTYAFPRGTSPLDTSCDTLRDFDRARASFGSRRRYLAREISERGQGVDQGSRHISPLQKGGWQKRQGVWLHPRKGGKNQDGCTISNERGLRTETVRTIHLRGRRCSSSPTENFSPPWRRGCSAALRRTASPTSQGHFDDETTKEVFGAHTLSMGTSGAGSLRSLRTATAPKALCRTELTHIYAQQRSQNTSATHPPNRRTTAHPRRSLNHPNAKSPCRGRRVGRVRRARRNSSSRSNQTAMWQLVPAGGDKVRLVPFNIPAKVLDPGRTASSSLPSAATQQRHNNLLRLHRSGLWVPQRIRSF